MWVRSESIFPKGLNFHLHSEGTLAVSSLSSDHLILPFPIMVVPASDTLLFPSLLPFSAGNLPHFLFQSKQKPSNWISFRFPPEICINILIPSNICMFILETDHGTWSLCLVHFLLQGNALIRPSLVCI